MSVFLHWLGLDDISGRAYAFWSGIGSDFGQLTLIGLLIGAWNRHNCHAKGCWRIARQQVKGTTLVVCRKHHPDGKPTPQDVLDAAKGKP